ncbi:ribose ABC transporter permease [candidate division KSB1 bacterium]|nr:ribose ABC transporter permease [candidate division KSB1 bacterium]
MKKGCMRPTLRFQSLGVLVALTFLVIVLSLASPHFATTENIFSVIKSFSFVAIMAMGETLAILTAGIDLSVGSILGFCGCLTALMLNAGWPVILAIAMGLFAGTAIGAVNGSLITRIKLPPFIVTLGMLSIVRGAAYVITGGWPVSGLPESFMSLGQGYIGLVPIPVLFMVGVAVLAAIFLNYTVTGRNLYAIGGNETAARLSGVPVDRAKVIAYTLSGFAAALAGILLVARLGVAQSVSGQGYELDAIAASVIGGTSLMGGEGRISGVIIGAAIMGVLRNGLVLLGVSAFWQQIALGAIIILAVSIDKLRK